MKSIKLYKQNINELIDVFIDQCQEQRECHPRLEEYYRGQINAFNTSKMMIRCANNKISIYKKLKRVVKNENKKNNK